MRWPTSIYRFCTALGSPTSELAVSDGAWRAAVKHWIADVRAIRSEGQLSDLQSYFCDSEGDDAALAANDRKVPHSRRQGGARDRREEPINDVRTVRGECRRSVSVRRIAAAQ